MSEKTVEWSSEYLGEAPDGYVQHLVVDVYYDKGGANIFGGRIDARGYYVSVTVETTKTEEHFTSRLLGIGDGLAMRQMLEPAVRFSAKRLQEMLVDADLIARMRTRVLERLEEIKSERAARMQSATRKKVSN